MSVHVDRPACTSGDHDRHNPEWGIRPGLIGGQYCACSGDCAERADAAAAEWIARFDDARTNRITEREADYLSPDEQAFLAAERAAEAQCPACGWTGARG